MSPQPSLHLRWNNYKAFVTGALDSFHQQDNKMLDITLFCEGRKIRAHKLLLAACSAYFKELFELVPLQHNHIIICSNISHDVMMSLVQFMYLGEVNVPQEHLAEFFRTADKLSIWGLTYDPSDQPAATASVQQTSQCVAVQDQANTTTNKVEPPNLVEAVPLIQTPLDTNIATQITESRLSTVSTSNQQKEDRSPQPADDGQREHTPSYAPVKIESYSSETDTPNEDTEPQKVVEIRKRRTSRRSTSVPRMSSVLRAVRKPQLCRKCGRRFGSVFAMRQHWYARHFHSWCPYECPVCMARFTTIRTLSLHILRCHLSAQ
ncbi:modifier of mdg4-like [Anopheles arabiensis]|uniref:modifier of mdg4-like n=1 Tax=Anopheles arabiensis TaxID=7173 RepID=UPI001AACC419|nr:modifier of mdg4-like [Anopheles arabiensis]